MSDGTDRLNNDQGARTGDGTDRMDAGTARMGGSQGVGSTGGGAVLAPGQTIVINGRNCVVESIISHSSGEAIVYKITMDGKPYALKHYKPNTPLSDTAKKVLNKIKDNPKNRVVKIFDFGSLNGHDFEIMEYAEGGTLDQYLKNNGAVKDPNKLKSIVKMITEGLQQLHGEYRVIYQDLKPENIYFKDTGCSSLVLADFGISSVMEGYDEETEVTASITDLYAAPELARMGQQTQVMATPSVDYFALGITMLELWLGEKPFKGIKGTIRNNTIRKGEVDFPLDMPEDLKTIIQGLIKYKCEDRWGNKHVKKWLNGEHLTIDSDVSQKASAAYEPLKFSPNESASNPKELAALMAKYPDIGKTSLYDGIIKDRLQKAGDLMLYTEIQNITSQYAADKDAGLYTAILALDPDRPFVSRGGKTCRTGEDIADAITAESAYYMDDLKNPTANLYLYLAATEGSQGEDVAKEFHKYFQEYSPKHALAFVHLKLQQDGGITIGSKRYLSPEELALENDAAQIDLIKKAVTEKDSLLLVWLSDKYGDYFKSTEAFGNLSVPDQFFLLSALPFLSFEKIDGSSWESALIDLINNFPGRSDLFDAYVAQGLPLKGQILGSPVKKTPIDYVACNFDGLSGTHGSDTVLNLVRLLHKLGADVNEYSGDGFCPFMNALANDKLADLLLELGADGDFVSRAGKVCKRGDGEEIADALMAESAYYMKNLKNPTARLYLYLAATEGDVGKEVAKKFCNFFNLYSDSPKRALGLVYINLQQDGGITIGSKHYSSPDELKQETDSVQLDLIKRAVKEKDSLLLVWLTDCCGDDLESTEEFGKLKTPEQFFLLGLLPFLSYKELSGNAGEVALKDLIDNYPGRADLFEIYAARGLPLKGQILGSPVIKTPIDYVACNFNALSAKHGKDIIYTLIRLLCKLGADVDEYSSDDTCPLINAFNANDTDLMNLLLELGADDSLHRELIKQREEKERKEREEQERIAEEKRKEQERIEKERELKRKKAEAYKIKRRVFFISMLCLLIGYLCILWGTDIIYISWRANGFKVVQPLPLAFLCLAISLLYFIYCSLTENDDFFKKFTLFSGIGMILIQAITICIWNRHREVDVLFPFIKMAFINTLSALPGFMVFRWVYKNKKWKAIIFFVIATTLLGGFYAWSWHMNQIAEAARRNGYAITPGDTMKTIREKAAAPPKTSNNVNTPEQAPAPPKPNNNVNTQEQAALSFPRSGTWSLTGRDTENVTASIIINSGFGNNRFTGRILWKSGRNSGIQQSFTGNYDQKTRKVSMQSSVSSKKMVDGVRKYEAYLSGDDKDFVSGTFDSGVPAKPSPKGKWEAKWQE